MNSIPITKLLPDDWQLYRDLRLRAVQTDPWAFGRSYNEELMVDEAEWRKRLELSWQPNNNLMLFAKENELVVGMVGALIGLSERNRHVAKVVSVYVVPAYRGKGIATQLMQALLLELKQNPAVIKVTLEASKDAIKLYKRVGFEQLCVLKNEHCVDGVYYDQTLMEKFI